MITTEAYNPIGQSNLIRTTRILNAESQRIAHETKTFIFAFIFDWLAPTVVPSAVGRAYGLSSLSDKSNPNSKGGIQKSLYKDTRFKNAIGVESLLTSCCFLT